MKKLLLFFVFLFFTSFVFSQVELGGTTNYSEVEEDGTLEFHGDATVWNDFVVNPNTAKNNGTNTPGWDLLLATRIYTWQFDKDNQEELQFSAQLPHDYKEGTDIHLHVHWCPTTAAGTNRVTWVVEYQWVNLDSDFVDSPGSTVSGYLVVGESGTPTVSLSTLQHTITPLLPVISGSSKTISSILLCRLYRDGPDSNDNYNTDAAILSIDFHYEINTIGSRSEFTK